MINMPEKLEYWTSVWSEQKEKSEQQEKIDDFTKEQNGKIRKALNVPSKTSRGDRRNGARELYTQGKLTYEQAKKIIDMMKTY